MTFAARLAAFVDEFFAHYPPAATAIGEHRHDASWPDTSDGGRLERVAWVDRWITELDEVDAATLTRDERVDRELLRGELDALRFAEAELRTESWDPLEWVYLLGFGLFPLTARGFAPLADRLSSVAGRLEGLPQVLADARAVIGSHPTRPIARLHAETAAKRLGGIAELGREALAEAERAAADGDRRSGGLIPRLGAALADAEEALEGFGSYLREVVIPASDGQGLLGRELFAAQLRHTLRDPEVTPDGLLARAEREFVAVRGEMVRIAGELWPQWCPDVQRPTDDGELVRGVLDSIARDHPGAGELLEFCRAELVRIEAFCEDRSLVELVDDPLDIRWTPEFLRSYAGAMLDSPGALDRGQRAFYAITPPRDDWGPDEVESFLRENNRRQLRLLTIHEAVPGHYLHGVYANRHPSLVRAVFRSGLTAEGWAVYVTQQLMDAGYADDDEALWLVHWKFYLRAVINAIIDVGIHTQEMTTEEAVRLMVDGGFQEEAEARAKDERARLSSTQLSTYFVGSLGMWDLEDEARRRAAQRAGAGRDAVPTPAVVGRYGETPGFELAAHLAACLAPGMPPLPILRSIVLGEGVAASRTSDR